MPDYDPDLSRIRPLNGDRRIGFGVSGALSAAREAEGGLRDELEAARGEGSSSIISGLQACFDPATGEHPVAHVFTGEELRPLSLGSLPVGPGPP